MAFRACLAAALLLLAPAANAATDHKDDGRCLGTLLAAIQVIDTLQTDDFAAEMAQYQQVRAAWLQALKDDPAIDPATLESIMDASRAENARFTDWLGEKISDEEYVAREMMIIDEADACVGYAPAAGN
jgi:hypothetical protein